MLALLITLALQAAPPQGPPAAPPAAPPATDIFVAALAPETDSGVRVLNAENITKNPGYDNQPSFVPGGDAILFTSNREGRQTDIYRYELSSKTLRPLTKTAESEYSPTVTPAGDRFSVIRVESDGTQRLWQFPLSGSGEPSLVLSDVRPVGYHAWADASTLVLFVLGEPATLRIADTKSGSAQVLVERPGRCIARAPGGKISFVQKGPAKEPWQIVELDPAAKTMTPVVETLPGSEDYAWLGDGRLLMASGPKIFLWDRTYRVKEWREVADLSSAGVKNITRMAVSADGRTLAFVAETAR